MSRATGREDAVSTVGTPAEALYCALLRATSVEHLENLVARELPALLSAERCRLYWPGTADDPAEGEAELPPAVRQALIRGAEVSVAQTPEGVMQVAVPLHTRNDSAARAILC